MSTAIKLSGVESKLLAAAVVSDGAAAASGEAGYAAPAGDPGTRGDPAADIQAGENGDMCARSGLASGKHKARKGESHAALATRARMRLTVAACDFSLVCAAILTFSASIFLASATAVAAAVAAAAAADIWLLLAPMLVRRRCGDVLAILSRRRCGVFPGDDMDDERRCALRPRDGGVVLLEIETERRRC